MSVVQLCVIVERLVCLALVSHEKHHNVNETKNGMMYGENVGLLANVVLDQRVTVTNTACFT